MFMNYALGVGGNASTISRAVRLARRGGAGEVAHRHAGCLDRVPLMAAAGSRGMFLARSRKGRWVDVKKKRMPFIAANV